MLHIFERLNKNNNSFIFRNKYFKEKNNTIREFNNILKMKCSFVFYVTSNNAEQESNKAKVEIRYGFQNH